MKAFDAFRFAFMAIHIVGLVIYNKYRVRQFIKYISLSRGKELSEREFLELSDGYTYFLGYAKLSPSKKDYPSLYANQAFAAFAKRSKTITVYLFSALAVGIIGSAIVSSLQR